MTGAFALHLVATAAISLSTSDMERRASHHLTEQFERVGRAVPVIDESLSRAARALAEEALQTSAKDAANVLSVSQAVSDAQGYDPSPRALVIRGTPPDQALASFLARADASHEPASRMGIGAAIRGESGALVALLAARKVTLKSFPRLVKPGKSPMLCGELGGSFRTADVFITLPSGDVDKPPVSLEGPRFCAKIGFPIAGRYSVEVVGQGAQGPEVAALFFVDAGSGAHREGRAHLVEPGSVPEARSAILGRINALRKAHHLVPVEFDDGLDSAAQKYSEQMASQGFFAHVAPDGSDLRGRLQKLGYGYRVAGENLGLAPGPVAAHFGIEQSPGHLRNLIDPRYTRLGLGIAYQRGEERPQTILTEIFTEPNAAPGDPLQAAYQSLQEKRAELKLPALQRSEVLEGIALEHAKRALELDQPKPRLPGVPLDEKVFAADKDIRTTTVDVFVSESPRKITDSKSLMDRRNDRVGVGAVKGDSRTYGKNKYWVVVIYASPK